MFSNHYNCKYKNNIRNKNCIIVEQRFFPKQRFCSTLFNFYYDTYGHGSETNEESSQAVKRVD